MPYFSQGCFIGLEWRFFDHGQGEDLGRFHRVVESGIVPGEGLDSVDSICFRVFIWDVDCVVDFEFVFHWTYMVEVLGGTFNIFLSTVNPTPPEVNKSPIGVTEALCFGIVFPLPDSNHLL